jgi:hypothetical protein
VQLLRSIATALAVAMLAGLPPVVGAGGKVLDSPEAAQQDFGAFCRQWVDKLDARERFNLSRAARVKQGEQVVILYTGYGDVTLSCEVTPTGVAASPFLGKLVYYEQSLRKAGANRDAALDKRAQIVRQIEVLELFHHDGTGWKY